MIPFIRSFSELMAITESRDTKQSMQKHSKFYCSTVDSGQRKRYIRSIDSTPVSLPSIPKTKRRKWSLNKESLFRLIDDLDYNNQIQSSYDLTLMERQNNLNQQDAA